MTSNADYHADPAISASHLHAVAASPYHYWSRFLNPSRPPSVQTAAMRLGSLVHCAVLEPDELANRYGICLPRNTKAGKEMAAEMEASGIEAVTASDMEQAMAMAGAVRQHPYAAALLSSGKAEQSFWFDDAQSGLRCKCRPDWLDRSTVVDLKTTTDASPSGFARSVASFRYHVQASHYLAGTFAERFIFIAVEKAYPYCVGVYELDTAAMHHGDMLRRQNLQTIADCRAINHWPGYSDICETISLPSWALRNESVLTSHDF
jgi:exodeoxyribonuclease VIII